MKTTEKKFDFEDRLIDFSIGISEIFEIPKIPNLHFQYFDIRNSPCVSYLTTE